MKFKDEKALKKFVETVKSCSTWEELASKTRRSAHDVRFLVYSLRTKYGAEFCPLLRQKKRADRRAKAIALRMDKSLNGGKGLPAKDIARRLNVSTATVCAWLNAELGPDWADKVPQHVATEDAERTARIMALRGQMNGAEIGKREGITRQRVHQIVIREMERLGMTGAPFPRAVRKASQGVTEAS